jgi:hypothetical protein
MFDFFLRRFLSRLAIAAFTTTLGFAVAYAVGTPLSSAQLVLAALVALTAFGVAIFATYRHSTATPTPLAASRITIGALTLAGAATIVLIHGRIRTVTIDSAASHCSEGSTICQIVVTGRIPLSGLAPHEAVLVLFRLATSREWIVGGISKPDPSSSSEGKSSLALWSTQFPVSASPETYEVVGLVGRESAHLGKPVNIGTTLSRTLVPTKTSRVSEEPPSGTSPCCGGQSCEPPTFCGSGWQRVPCRRDLQNRQWLLRVGSVRSTNEHETFPPSNEELEVCVRAAETLQCLTYPGPSRTFPLKLSTEALESSAFTISVRSRAFYTKSWELVGRGQHHRVLVVPSAVCNGVWVPLNSGRFSGASIFLDQG